MERADAIKILRNSLEELEKAQTKAETLAILSNAGKQMGYKPVFRCLVMGQDPEEAVRW